MNIGKIIAKVETLSAREGLTLTDTAIWPSCVVMEFRRGTDRYVRVLSQANYRTATARAIIDRAHGFFRRVDEARQIGFFALEAADLGRVFLHRDPDPSEQLKVDGSFPGLWDPDSIGNSRFEHLTFFPPSEAA